MVAMRRSPRLNISVDRELPGLEDNMPEVSVEAATTTAQVDTNIGGSHWQMPIRRAPTRLSDIDQEANAYQDNAAEGTTDIRDDNTIGSWEEIPTPRSETRPGAGPHEEAAEEAEVVEEIVREDADDALYDAIMAKDIEAVKATLEMGAKIECRTQDNYTFLVISILERLPDITKLLLATGADVNHRVCTLPPIVHAIMQEKCAPELIQHLVDHGASLVTVSGPEDMNALHWAAVDGMIDAVDFLLSKDMDMNTACSKGRTPLILAAEKGWIAIVKLLVTKGAELHRRSDNGATAMIWAACNGHLEVVNYLLEAGIDVDDEDRDGLTSLSIACNLGKLEVVKCLIEKGADINKLSIQPKDYSPAMAAAIAGHHKVLEVLIEHNADLTIQSGSGNTALQATLLEGHLDAAKVLIRAIGGPEYPQDSVALQVAVSMSHSAIRSLVSTASLMYQCFQTRGTGQFAWLAWMLESGGDLVKEAAMSNMLHASLFENDLGLVQALFDHGCDPSQHLDSGNTPLSFAIRHRKLDLIRLLLDAGADPAKPAIDNEDINLTPLHQAVAALEGDKDKDTTIIDMLLETGRCKLSEGKKVHSTVFAYVLRQMNEEDNGVAEVLAFRMLNSVKDVNADRCDDGSTLMHAAVRYDRIDLVEILIEKGADINATNNLGQTPLLLKCLLPTTRLPPLLIERGADIFTKDKYDRTCLHMAADSGNINALELLLEKGLDIEAKTADGYTPLLCALDARAQGAALFLLDSGANHAVTNFKRSRNILHFAAALGLERVVNRILSTYPDIDINAPDAKQWTPLALACRKGSPTLIQTLLSAGADPEAAEEAGERPLHISLITSNERISMLLLEHGVDTAATGSRARTPLHLAAEYGNLAATRFLLSHSTAAINAPDALSWTPLMLTQIPALADLLLDAGADVNHVDSEGWTPLHQAVASGSGNMFKALLRRGAEYEVRTRDDGLSVGERVERMADVVLRERFREITHEYVQGRRRALGGGEVVEVVEL